MPTVALDWLQLVPPPEYAAGPVILKVAAELLVVTVIVPTERLYVPEKAIVPLLTRV